MEKKLFCNACLNNVEKESQLKGFHRLLMMITLMGKQYMPDLFDYAWEMLLSILVFWEAYVRKLLYTFYVVQTLSRLCFKTRK